MYILKEINTTQQKQVREKQKSTDEHWLFLKKNIKKLFIENSYFYNIINMYLPSWIEMQALQLKKK